jgi:hypothetical protein
MRYAINNYFDKVSEMLDVPQLLFNLDIFYFERF